MINNRSEIQKENKFMIYGRFQLVVDEKDRTTDAILLEANTAFADHFSKSKKDIIGTSKLDLFADIYQGKENEWSSKYYDVCFKHQQFEETVYSESLNTHFELSVFSPAVGEFIILMRKDFSIEEEEELSRLILNLMSDAIFVTNNAGKITFVTPGASRLFGESVEEIYGKGSIKNILGDACMHLLDSVQEKNRFFEVLVGTASDSFCEVVVEMKSLSFSKNYSILFVCKDITDKNKAIKEALDQRERLRAIINTIPDLVWMKDIGGKYLACNSEFESFYGASENEIIGKRDHDFVSDELADFFRKHDLKAMKLKRPSKNEEIITYKSNGREVDVETTKTPFYDSEGELVGVLGIARDITERNSIQRELVATNIKLEQLINTVDGILWEAHPETLKFSFISNKVEEVLGYSPQEWFSSDTFWVDHLYEGDKERVVNFCLDQTRKGKSHQAEFRFYKKDGSVIWVKEYVTVVKNEEGAVINLVGLTMDIDEQLRNKQDLGKYHRFFQIAQDNFCIANTDGILLELNPQFLKTLGYTLKELGQKDFSDLVHPEDLKSTLSQIEDLNTSEKTVNFRNRYKTKTGEYRHFDWSTVLYDGFYYGVARDVTEEVNAKVNLEFKKELLDKAQQTAKLGHWTWSKSSNKLHCSDEIFRVFGEEPQAFEVTVKTYYNFIHPDDRSYVRSVFNESIRKRQPYQLIHRIFTKEGYIKYVEEKSEMIFDTEGELVSAIGTVQDITSRYLIEEELKLRDENLSKFFENVHVGIARNSMDGSFIEINPEFQRFTGYTEKELIKMSYWDLTPKIYARDEEKQLASLKNEGRYGPYHKHYITKEGELVPVLLNGVKTFDANGNEYIWSVIQDITEEEEFKNQLQQDVAKFKLLLDIGKLIAFEVDLETRNISTIRERTKINSSAFPIHEVKNLDDFLLAVKKEHRNYYQRKLQQLINKEIDQFSGDFQIKQGNEYFWHETVLTILESDESGKPIKIFITLKNIEEEKNEEKKRLINQEKERLRISRDIHDSIGQMLVGTRLTLKLKKDNELDLSEIDELLDEMIKESRLIINNFGISLQESDNLYEAFRRLKEKMNKIYEGKIKIGWKGNKDIDDLKVSTNIFRISQEALSNAIKYAQSERIDIYVRNTEGFEMDVVDYGLGFDLLDVETGFGVHNMQERANEIGGEIEIRSVLGKGTIIKFRYRN